jgi:hypothetical protein
MPDDEALSIWVIYDHPRDYPHAFVARRHIAYGPNAGPTDDVVVNEKLLVVRKAMQRRFLTCMPRFPDDDPMILETWL